MEIVHWQGSTQTRRISERRKDRRVKGDKKELELKMLREREKENREEPERYSNKGERERAGEKKDVRSR